MWGAEAARVPDDLVHGVQEDLVESRRVHNDELLHILLVPGRARVRVRAERGGGAAVLPPRGRRYALNSHSQPGRCVPPEAQNTMT